MKITKLMLSALVAAAALVSCNKQDLDSTANGTGMKSVEISIENIIMTKGDAGDTQIKEGQPVHVNSLRIFLTDENLNVYSANDGEGNEATFYWDGDDVNLGTIQYHFVDPKCTRVVVAANIDEGITLAALKNLEVKIEDEQNPTELLLVDEAELVRDPGNSYHTQGEYTEVWTADIELAPAISRFEVDGFSIDFEDDPKYASIEVTDIAFDNYWPSIKLDDFVPSTQGPLVKHVGEEPGEEVYTWFTDLTEEVWYRDSFTDLEMTPDNSTKTTDPRAYHFFKGTEIPRMFINLSADGIPAYVWTNTYKDQNGDPVTKIEAGKIYRMSSGAVVEGGDGVIVIPEEKIDPINRCIDVNIEVVDWQVVLVTPEF